MIATILTGAEMQKQIWTRLREYSFGTEYGRLDGKCVHFKIPSGYQWDVYVNLSSQPKPSGIWTGRGFLAVMPGTILARSGGALSAKREAVIIGTGEPSTSVHDLDVMAKVLEDLDRACNKERAKVGA